MQIKAPRLLINRHGVYTLSQDNPVQCLHIHTKKTRKASTQSFQPFPVAALQTLFEPRPTSLA
jgi:hypothetical protein